MRNFIHISAAFLLFQTFLYAGDGSATGMSFLKIGVDAASSAMGGAAVANASNASAAYWNPAGIAVSDEINVIFSNQEWLAGSNNQFLGINIPSDKLNFGLSIALSGVGDIEKRDGPTVEPLGYFSSNSLAMAFSTATALNGNLKIGVTAKFLYEKIHIYSATGFALDLGLIKNFDFFNLKSALVLKDIGNMSTLSNESTSLPTRITGGLSSGFDPTTSLSLNWAFDAGKYLESDSFVRLGGELIHNDMLSLRGGYRRNSENSSGITAGIGIRLKRYSFDYAYLPFDFNLGDTHQISFGIGI
ncbi:PorV/PorQ family protein [Candidatus Marinimicrobia bacterium MT.SAG.3]|nr:PorV/PorQ family protein [Candidatus Marinimicrobia bacterium MT.SAG.3]